MTKEELRKDLDNLYREISNAVFTDECEIREAFLKLLRFNEHLIANIDAFYRNVMQGR